MRWETDAANGESDDDGESHGDDWQPDDDDISLEELAEQDADQTVPCPYCGKLIHEDSQRCPSCEYYISEEDAPPSRKPWWIIIGILVTLTIAILWAVGG